MKKTLVLLSLVLLLATAGTALADSAPTAPADGAPPLVLEPEAPPHTPAVSFAEGVQEPLFTGDAICVVPLPGATDCTLSTRCSRQAVCTETGTPVKVQTCTCCIPCSGPSCPVKPECSTVSYPVGCC